METPRKLLLMKTMASEEILLLRVLLS